jgi:PAS domain S-box-containing protein
MIGDLLRERILAARRAEARLRRAQSTGGVADWEWTVDTGEVLWSESFFSLLGIAPHSAPAGAATVYRAMHPDDQQRVHEVVAGAVRTLDRFDAEFRVFHPDGSLHWLATRAEAVRDPDGMRRVVGVVIDVTKRKEAELQREMMFHELNHRVKNNFQIVGSMLRLQAARVRDAAARGHLDSAVQRVMTVADVHSALYQSGHIDTLDLGKYLTSLCRKLQTSVMAASPVALDLQTVPAVFKVDRAIPLGLIANELITNAVKHAFPGGRAGRITVKLARHDEGYVLSISDDGIGMAEGEASHDGLGMRMVEAFVDQANGRMKLTRYAGTHFEIVLPDETLSATT